MSIRALYGMPERRGMVKRAEGAIAGVFQVLGNLVSLGYAQLLAAAVLTGGGIGYTAAKMTAKGTADIGTARKSFQNERARADIGYLATKLKDEHMADKDLEKEKPMRMM